MTDSNKEKPRTWKYYILYTLAMMVTTTVMCHVFAYLPTLLNGIPFEYDVYGYLFRPMLFGLLLGAYYFHVDVNRNN